MLSHLTDMFVRFNLAVLPREETFRQNILNLAKTEIAIKPLFLCSQIRSGIPDQHMEAFWSQLSVEELNSLYSCLIPTAEKVIDKLTTEADDLRPHEETVLYYLKDFLYSLNTDDLVLFLQFVTGSDVLPYDPIVIVFNQRVGLQRVPVAHTCGNTLELPVSYQSIQEFKREFLNILHQQETFQMSMA